jgi:hypothetical protein
VHAREGGTHGDVALQRASRSRAVSGLPRTSGRGRNARPACFSGPHGPPSAG